MRAFLCWFGIVVPPLVTALALFRPERYTPPMSRPTRIIAVVAIIGIALYAAAVLLAEHYLHLDRYKTEILAELQNSLGRKVQYETGDVSLALGPSFTFNHVTVKEKDGTANFITAERITFRVPLLPLLEKKLVLRRIVLDHPVIALSRDRDGTFNVADLLERKGGAEHLAIRDVRIRKGTLTFRDGLAGIGLTTSLSDLDLSANRLVRGKTTDIKLSARIGDEEKTSDIALSGTVNLPDSRQSLADTRMDLKLHARGLNGGRFWPYYQKYVPFKRPAGRIDTDSTFKGKLAAFAMTGSLRITRLRFDYPQVFHATLNPREISGSYKMELTPRDLNISPVSLNIDGVKIDGSCELKDIHSKDLRIIAKATSSPIRLQQFGQYIPYGIIPTDTSNYIEQHIKGGTYRLEEGLLDGRISQIVHMEQGTNYNVLYIRARVDDGLLSYGDKVPTFNGISGRLELKGKDFNLIGMKASFGGSPFTLEGTIGDYPLETPTYYRFTMDMIPGAREVAWLLRQENNPRFAFYGQTALHLTGDGPTDDYRLSGNWNLNQASYSYPGIVGKPQGHPSNVTFTALLDRNETRVTSLRYQLDSLSLAAAATYRYAGGNPFSVAIRSNLFPIGEIAGMVPKLKPYAPRGKVQVDLTATGHPTADGLQVGGNATFAGLSFRPSSELPAVSSLNGAVRFNGSTIETTQLDFRLGGSLLHGRGTLSGFTHPSFSAQFYSPELDVADLGMKPPPGGLKLKKVQANLSFQDDLLQIRSLSTQINLSHLSVKGTVSSMRAPRLDLSISSPYLDLADLMLLTRLKPKGETESPDMISLKALVTADAGRVKQIEFHKLRTTVLYEDNILYLQPLECRLFAGTLTAKCRFDLGGSGTEPRYQTDFRLADAAAQQLLRALDERQESYPHGFITGTLTAQGDITAKGNTAQEWKQSALGNVRFHLVDGTLKRFSVLSKVFSLLNVSQLLKLQLPDMVSGGMPYSEINASFAIRDGVVATNDLFIDSDAMNISLIGNINLARDDIDMRIGVKPLQTVDKVVSHLPVVGWILTGRDKALVTAYFEAKGKLSDPTVNAVPVKSLTKGVFDIFKRVFQLPVKLMTDTGEVIVNTK